MESHAHLGITGRYVTNAHVLMARRALSYFEKVIVMPSAQVRKDKEINVSAWDRWMMTVTAFQELLREFPSRLVLSNRIVFETRDFTTVEQIELLKKESDRKYVVCVGSDNVLPSTEDPQISRVEASWKEGVKLWKEYPWVVFQRPGTLDVATIRLPRDCMIINGNFPFISSTAVREKMLRGENWQDDMPKAEVEYILHYELHKK